jgi:transcriptional regulator with XRE-family HTH domain
MKERLLKFLNTIQLSSSRFAEEIGIQPSGVSHILSGRNNPGYDFIVKILTKYPDLNPEWLILGKGEMFKKSSVRVDLFDETEPEMNIQTDVTNVKSDDPVSYRKSSVVEKHFVEPHDLKKSVRIVMFFKDGSFREYFSG